MIQLGISHGVVAAPGHHREWTAVLSCIHTGLHNLLQKIYEYQEQHGHKPIRGAGTGDVPTPWSGEEEGYRLLCVCLYMLWSIMYLTGGRKTNINNTGPE